VLLKKLGGGEDLDGVARLGQVEGEIGEQLGGGGVAGGKC
jgi:hypothetical protein